MKFLLLLISVLVALFMMFMGPGAIEHGPGEIAPDVPRQEKIHEADPIRLGDYRLTPLARFQVEARVLSRRGYRFDGGASLSPLDLALGWGPMSDSTVLERIDISQRDRFFYWRTDEFPIPRREIETNAANMHIIPADDQINAMLDDVRVGHVVTLEGMLVEAHGDDGFRWKSSLTRSDTGKGACELFYVQSVAVR